MTPFPPTAPDPASHARDRRARLTERLAGEGLDCALITDPRDIAYFTAAPLGAPPSIPACLLVTTRGDAELVCGEADAEHRVDHVETYQWHRGGTIFTELMPRLTEHAASRFRIGSSRVGVQHESVAAQLVSGLGLGATTPIDRIVLDLERTKDSLDLFRIRGAIDANLGAFDEAAAAIAPGVSELQVFTAAARGAMLRAGEKILHDGDYRCGAAGGPCRDHAISAGQLYIIDAWTNRAGYWSDLARTFSVGTPSKDQASLLRHVRSIHDRVRSLLRTGTSGHDLWSAIDGLLREHPAAGSGLVHHGGHGIGLRLHETPDINPGVKDRLRTGDVVCIEPGVYAPGAHVRIEETYLITEDGAECLSVRGSS